MQEDTYTSGEIWDLHMKSSHPLFMPTLKSSGYRCFCAASSGGEQGLWGPVSCCLLILVAGWCSDTLGKAPW